LSRQRLTRLAAAVLAALSLAVAACGDDEEGPASRDTGTATTTSSTPGPPAAPGQTAPEAEATETEQQPGAPREPEPRPGGGSGVSPEDEEGGAGDEIPASAQALFTGRGGRIEPRLVRVPPFIAIRVVLRSADGASYALSGAGGRVVAARARSPRGTAVFDGLRPGRRLVLRGSSGSVTIEASAEPGP